MGGGEGRGEKRRQEEWGSGEKGRMERLGEAGEKEEECGEMRRKRHAENEGGDRARKENIERVEA